MPSLFTLEESNIVVSNGGQLDGVTQGDGSHLDGETITLLNNSWITVDITDNDADFEDNDGNQTLTNQTTYDGVTHAAGTRVEAEYTITVEDSEGNQYQLIAFNINEAGQNPRFGTVEGLAFVDNGNGFPPINEPLTVVSTSEGPNNADTPYTEYTTPPCFVAGTLIEGLDGPRPVESLKAGDVVVTRDAGPQPILWIGKSTFDAAALAANPDLLPVRIKAGAISDGAPSRDLLVSPS